MEFLNLIAIFIVIFISTNTIEKSLKTIVSQNERVIELLLEIKESQEKE
ncbi:hypothetical protein [Oceanobacillus chungangensis]|nr:hypothetical protein [Oceanobacillus chungangensis]